MALLMGLHTWIRPGSVKIMENPQEEYLLTNGWKKDVLHGLSDGSSVASSEL